MSNLSVNRVFPALFLSYTAGYIVLFIWTLFFPSAVVLPTFQLEAAFITSFILFIDFLIPIHCTGILIAYSLVIPSRRAGYKSIQISQFHKIVSPILVLFLFLTGVYTVTIIWFEPMAHQNLMEKESKTRIARVLHDKAKEAYNRENGPEARYYNKAALFVVSTYEEARKLEEKINNMNDNGREIPFNEKKEKLEEFQPRGEFTLDQLVDLAGRYMKNEDYYSAYYYADMALNIDGTNLKARTIANESLSKIRSIGLSEEEEKKRKYYKEKEEAYVALSNNNLIKAYYTFVDLKKQDPKDPDVIKYLDISRQQVSKIAFFKDEVADVAVLPGKEGILFINQNTKEAMEIIYIDKMVNIENNFYFKDLEVLKFLKNGYLLYHYKAPYGKYIYVAQKDENAPRHYININAIDRTDQSKNTKLQFYSGSLAGSDFKNIIQIKPNAVDMQYLSVERIPPRQMGFNELISFGLAKPFSNPQPIEEYGFSKREMDMEILLRCLYPFSFFILSLFSISAGWFFRSRYAIRPPIATLIIIPLFPIVTHFLVTLYHLVFRTVFGLTILTAGLEMSMIIGGCTQIVILMIALFILAGQAAE
ncbi:MAG: hypothetical protein JW969_10450 [Spirochaetales bacterium]|nr:hypothetical protein [Spirochaetales bacterium]